MVSQIYDQPFFSLIVPAYKQEKIIVKNIRALQKVLDNIRYEYEIIVVVDGEVDETSQLLKKAKLPHTKILSYMHNKGKAYAIRQGMLHSKGDYVMFIDSGDDIDPNGISMLLEHMEWYNADIMVGSKRHPASQVEYTLSRKILSQGYYYLVKLLFGIKVSDTQAGIKIFKRKVVSTILPLLVERRFAGDLEMLVVAKKHGFDRIFDAPIKLSYDLGGVSNAATLKQITWIFLDTIALFYRVRVIGTYNRKK